MDQNDLDGVGLHELETPSWSADGVWREDVCPSLWEPWQLKAHLATVCQARDAGFDLGVDSGDRIYLRLGGRVRYFDSVRHASVYLDGINDAMQSAWTK